MRMLDCDDSEHLEKAVQKLESDPKYLQKWASVPATVKSKVLDSIHESLCEDLLSEALDDEKPKPPPKTPGKRGRKPKVSTPGDKVSP